MSVSNLLDETYFLTGNGFGTSVAAGTPRSVLVTLAYRFDQEF